MSVVNMKFQFYSTVYVNSLCCVTVRNGEYAAEQLLHVHVHTFQNVF